MKSLRYLLVKEYKQMFRGYLIPILFVLVPFALTNIVPRIATQEVSNLNIAVIDNDYSSVSTRLTEKMSASEFFNLQAVCGNYVEAYDLLQRGDVDFIVTIENGFERNLYRESTAKMMSSVNAVNGMKGGLGDNYLTQIIMQYAKELNEEAGKSTESPMNIHPRFLFNSQLDYKPYMIPALMSLGLILLMGFLPALNMVGEKEKGTIEQINVTPVGRVEFILSKLIPYWTVGLFIVAFSLVLAWKIHTIVPAGSIALVFLFALVYIMTVSALGIIVANYSDTMRQAAMLMFFFIIIFVLTSGLVSPVSSMPDWAQEVTRLNPVRYIIAALREIFLKGSTFTQLLPQFIPLCIYGLVSMTCAVFSYQKKQ